MLIRLSFFWRAHPAYEQCDRCRPATHDNAVSTSFGPTAPNYRCSLQRSYMYREIYARTVHPAHRLASVPVQDQWGLRFGTNAPQIDA
jgi:hypothetical protein